MVGGLRYGGPVYVVAELTSDWHVRFVCHDNTAELVELIGAISVA